MAATEVEGVYDIKLSAMEELADEILLGRYWPSVGEYVLVWALCWFDTVVTPTYQGTFTNYEYAKESLDLYERMKAQYGNDDMCYAYELWHVVD